MRYSFLGGNYEHIQKKQSVEGSIPNYYSSFEKRVVLGAVDLLTLRLPCYLAVVTCIIILVFIGLITPVCSYILSEGILCHSHSSFRFFFVLSCVADLIPYQLSCPGS